MNNVYTVAIFSHFFSLEVEQTFPCWVILVPYIFTCRQRSSMCFQDNFLITNSQTEFCKLSSFSMAIHRAPIYRSIVYLYFIKIYNHTQPKGLRRGIITLNARRVITILSFSDKALFGRDNDFFTNQSDFMFRRDKLKRMLL